MRTLTSACVSAAAIAASVLLAPAAYATKAPGDNGTIKIHDAKTGEDLIRNEPHVCTFYLDAFHFDGRQAADWKIVEMPPTGTKDKVAKTGAITLDAQGHGRTADMSLPDGHYKLIWNFDGEHGQAKHKVFWTDCKGEGTPGPQPSGTPSPSAGTGTPTPTATPSASQTTPSGSTKPSGSTTPAPGPSSSRPGGNLASTGASVGGYAAAAALLLGAGGTLVMVRRRDDSTLPEVSRCCAGPRPHRSR